MFIEVTLYDKFHLDKKLNLNTENIEAIEADPDGDAVIQMVSGVVHRTIENNEELMKRLQF
jgi:uncharacterized protein YlzI (FlbEa/FlbD family)